MRHWAGDGSDGRGGAAAALFAAGSAGRGGGRRGHVTCSGAVGPGRGVAVT